MTGGRWKAMGVILILCGLGLFLYNLLGYAPPSEYSSGGFSYGEKLGIVVGAILIVGGAFAYRAGITAQQR